MVDSADTTGRGRRTNEYRIEKDRHPVTLTLLGGEHIVDAMFVQGHARHRSAPEDPWTQTTVPVDDNLDEGVQ